MISVCLSVCPKATVLSSGHVALVYNPTTSQRCPLRISISTDRGETWPHSRDLETCPSSSVVPASSIEYSYPSLLQSPDGFIHVSYTYDRKTIKYVKFLEDWVLHGD